MAHTFASLTFISLAMFHLGNDALGDKVSAMADNVCVSCEELRNAHILAAHLVYVWKAREYDLDMIDEVLLKVC